MKHTKSSKLGINFQSDWMNHKHYNIVIEIGHLEDLGFHLIVFTTELSFTYSLTR